MYVFKYPAIENYLSQSMNQEFKFKKAENSKNYHKLHINKLFLQSELACGISGNSNCL